MREVSVYLDGVLLGSGSLLSQESWPHRIIEFAPQVADISGSGALSMKLMKLTYKGVPFYVERKRRSKGHRKHVRKVKALDRKGK